MKVHVNRNGKGLEVEYPASEMPLINRALCQFVRNPENALLEKHEWLVYYDEDCPQDGIFKCPVCGQIISVDTPIPLNFCPNCGTDMRN